MLMERYYSLKKKKNDPSVREGQVHKQNEKENVAERFSQPPLPVKKYENDVYTAWSFHKLLKGEKKVFFLVNKVRLV